MKTYFITLLFCLSSLPLARAAEPGQLDCTPKAEVDCGCSAPLFVVCSDGAIKGFLTTDQVLSTLTVAVYNATTKKQTEVTIQRPSGRLADVLTGAIQKNNWLRDQLRKLSITQDPSAELTLMKLTIPETSHVYETPEQRVDVMNKTEPISPSTGSEFPTGPNPTTGPIILRPLPKKPLEPYKNCVYVEPPSLVSLGESAHFCTAKITCQNLSKVHVVACQSNKDLTCPENPGVCASDLDVHAQPAKLGKGLLK